MTWCEEAKKDAFARWHRHGAGSVLPHQQQRRAQGGQFTKGRSQARLCNVALKCFVAIGPIFISWGSSKGKNTLGYESQQPKIINEADTVGTKSC